MQWSNRVKFHNPNTKTCVKNIRFNVKVVQTFCKTGNSVIITAIGYMMRNWQIERGVTSSHLTTGHMICSLTCQSQGRGGAFVQWHNLAVFSHSIYYYQLLEMAEIPAYSPFFGVMGATAAVAFSGKWNLKDSKFWVNSNFYF